MKKNFEKKKNCFFFLFSKVLKVRCPGWKTSGFQTVRILKNCRTSEPDVMSDRALRETDTKKLGNFAKLQFLIDSIIYNYRQKNVYHLSISQNLFGSSFKNWSFEKLAKIFFLSFLFERNLRELRKNKKHIIRTLRFFVNSFYVNF